MERQAAYQLFSVFIKKQGIKSRDVSKDLPLLLNHAESLGFFTNPHSVHELEEWRKYGEKLWELVLEDDRAL